MTEYLRADPQRRTDVRFASAGEEPAGQLYRPPGAKQDERTPAVALCGPISSVKEQTLPHYAERLADNVTGTHVAASASGDALWTVGWPLRRASTPDRRTLAHQR